MSDFLDVKIKQRISDTFEHGDNLALEYDRNAGALVPVALPDEVAGNAAGITYDPSESGLEATNVQDALDEIVEESGSGNAVDIVYDPTASGLAATNVQEALDEVVEESGSGNAVDIVYDPAASGLDSVNVQDAIDNLSTLISSIEQTPPSERAGLVNGGQVVWEGGLTFRVSAATYYIGGTLYNSAEQTIALDAADPNDDRIDVIALDVNEVVVGITGTPATPAGEPSIDPQTQLKLVIVTIPEDAVEPDLSNTNIYLEGAAEWTDSTSGSGWTLDSTSNPRTGTKCEEATSVAANAWIQWASPSTVDLTGIHQLVFYIRSKAAWAAAKLLRIRFQSTGLLRGVEITLRDGYWGFDSGLLGVYQQIAIPISQFQVTSTINQLRMTVIGGGAGIGFYLDDIFLQRGLIPTRLPVSTIVGEFLFGVPGELVVLANAAFPVAVPRNMVGGALTGWKLIVGASGNGNTIIDINLNGTTIWSTQANRPTLGSGLTTATGSTFNTTALASEDVLTLDVDSVPGSPPTKLAFYLYFRQTAVQL